MIEPPVGFRRDGGLTLYNPYSYFLIDMILCPLDRIFGCGAVGLYSFLCALGTSYGDVKRHETTERDVFLSIRLIEGQWHRWQESPIVMPSSFEKGVALYSVIWSGVAISDNSVIMLGRSVGKGRRDGILVDLRVFEKTDDGIRLVIYEQGDGGILESVSSYALDLKTSTSRSLVWRDTEGQAFRLALTGKERLIQMQWFFWIESRERWVASGPPFRRDPPPEIK